MQHEHSGVNRPDTESGGEHTNGNGKHPLSDKHLADLRKSGLNDETIRRCQFATIKGKAVKTAIGWESGTDKLGSCLSIPFLDRAGKPTGFVRVKPDKPRTKKEDGKTSTVKYEQPKGKPIRPYFPPMAWPLIDDRSQPLLITEGEKKAAKAAQEGFAVIGLTGVDCWSVREKTPPGEAKGERLLHPDLAALPLTGRVVCVVYDSDLPQKLNVQWAEYRLAEKLRLAGAVVKSVRLPGGPAGEKVGLDDFLCQHTADDLRKLLEEAGEPTEPPKSGKAKKEAAGVKPAGDARIEVEITPDEHQVVRRITAALAQDEELFQRDGKLVRPLKIKAVRPPEPDAEKPCRRLRIEYQPGMVVLQLAEPAYIRLRITNRCYLWKIGKEGEEKHVNPPSWLAHSVAQVPGPIRPIAGLLPGPTLDTDGRLINSVGYDAASRWFMGRCCPSLALPESPTLVEAIASANTLCELVSDFPFAEEADRSRWLCLLLTACCRHLIGRTPLGLITANQAGAGKTYLGRLISIIAHGLMQPILMSWPEGTGLMSRSDEIRKRLASLLTEGATLVLIDNLPRGEDFGSPEVDAFLTSDAYHDRQLGKNDGSRVGGPNRCLLLATGNNVMPCGDTADRTLLVRLWTADPNPRSRPPAAFRCPALERHALDNRPHYLAAALTIWRAWLLADCPKPAGPSWGSFESFVDTTVSIIRWLELPDPIGDRTRQIEETDREGQSLRAMLALWREVLGSVPIGCGTIITTLNPGSDREERRTFWEALETLGRIGKWPPTPQKIGKVLFAYKGRVVEVETAAGTRQRLVLRSEYSSDTKTHLHFVEALTGGRPASPVHGESGELRGMSSTTSRAGGENHSLDACSRNGSGTGEYPYSPALPVNGEPELETYEL